MDILSKWLSSAENKENFYIDDDAPKAPDGCVYLSAGGSFTFSLSLSPPFAVSISRATALQKDFVLKINKMRHATVNDALNACSVHCVDAMEYADDSDGGNDDDDGALAGVDQEELRAQQQRAAMALEAAREAEEFDRKTLSKAAAERILRDMRRLRDCKHDGWTAAPVGRDLSTWAVELTDFEAGSSLAKDMEKVRLRTGKAAIEMRMTFPPDYPFKPPFLRVVRPRFMFRTGRVTVGGSICTQLLTDEPDGWKPIYDVESIIITIRQQITDPSSNAQIDHSNAADYTETEARSAFERVAAQHKAQGWD